MPAGEGGEVHQSKRNKPTELVRIVEDDSDGTKTRETYVSSGNGLPVIFHGVWGNIRRHQEIEGTEMC